MDRITEAALATLSTLSILPLIPFCFFPISRDDIKGAPSSLWIKAVAAVLAMEAAFFGIYWVWPDISAVPELFCILILFPLYQREIRLKQSHLWFVFMTACMIGSFSFLFYSIADIFLHPTATIYDATHIDSFLVQITLELVLVLLLVSPVKKHLGWLIHHFNEEIVWNLIWLFPASFILFASVFVPYSNGVMYQGRFLEVYLIAICTILVFILLIYVLFYLTARLTTQRQELLQKNACLELQARQYQLLQAHMQETRRLRHDFRHQLTVIAGMLKRQDYSELDHYLQQYIVSISDTPVHYCASLPVNALLNHYATSCREQQIQAHFQIRLPEALPALDTDLCVLLGNLLENAVDACHSLPEPQKQILLKIGQTTPHVIALQISNSCAEAPHMRGGRILSSKHNGFGQGLESVRLIAEKYNGFLEIQPEPPVFEVKVLLNI